ncbi:MAG: aldo/keto reductase [Clostridia bacterium]|nr:aldo/keto reductase [Clostridia bacterium]
MRYGTITGLAIPASRIFFGTATGPFLNGDNADELLDGVFERGVNAFDCARSYGRAEEVLGDWIKRRGNRDKVVILSKCGDIRNGVVKINRQVITEQLEMSLKTLQTDCIDIYLLHRDDPDTPVGEYIETLNEAKRAGKIRIFGVSNWTTDRIREANRCAEAERLEGFNVSSPNFGLARQMKDLWGGGCVSISGPEHQADRNWYSETGMPVVAYSSLGRGFFSGKFRSDDPEGARSVLDSYAQKGYLYPENMIRLRKAEQLAKQYGETVAEIAMRYVFSNRMNMFAVVSTNRPERMDSSIRAAAEPLAPAETAWLEEEQD